MSAPYNMGDVVTVEGWGFSGTEMVVAEERLHDRQPYYDLDFRHNGNRCPGHYHHALLRAVA